MATKLEPAPPPSPTTPHLLSLPTEILNEIIQSLRNEPGKSSLHSLCLTSQLLREITQPILLEAITIGIPVNHKPKHYIQLQNSANGDSVASVYARTLTIGAIHLLQVTTIDHLKSQESYPGPHDDPEISKCVRDALFSIAPNELCLEFLSQPKFNPQTGVISEDIPCCLKTLVEELIPMLPQLRSLEVNAKDVSFFIPSAYIHAKPSQIEHLALKWTEFSVEGLQLMIRHLPKLKSISFRALAYAGWALDPKSVPHPSKLWSMLQDEGVWLTKITTDTWTDTRLISYLKSYKGLEALTLEFLDFYGIHQNHPPTFGPQQLLAALHANSLTTLGFRAEVGQLKWSFPSLWTKEFETLLVSLTNLEKVELTLSQVSEDSLKYLIRFFDNSLPCLDQLQFIIPFPAKVRREAEFSHFNHQHSILSLSDCLHQDDAMHRRAIKAIKEYENINPRYFRPFSIVIGTSIFKIQHRMPMPDSDGGKQCIETDNSMPEGLIDYFSHLMDLIGVAGDEIEAQKSRMQSLADLFRSEPN